MDSCSVGAWRSNRIQEWFGSVPLTLAYRVSFLVAWLGFILVFWLGEVVHGCVRLTGMVQGGSVVVQGGLVRIRLGLVGAGREIDRVWMGLY